MKLKKLFNKKIFNKKTLIISIILVLFAVSTLLVIDNFKTKKIYSNIPEGEILLVKHYKNYAWLPTNYGYIVDYKGDVYYFNYSSKTPNNYSIPTIEYEKEYKRLKNTTQPICTISKKDVCNLYKWNSKVNIKSKFTGENTAMDSGVSSFMFYHKSSKQFITCYTTGDYTGQLNDFYAKKLSRLYKYLDKKIIEHN